MQFRVTDLLVLLEGDVPTDHVGEEDAEGPHGGRDPMVARAPYPLGRGVHPRPVELSVGVLLQEGPRAKVDHAQLARLHVYQDVLILDVSMDDSFIVAGSDGGNDLAEEVLGEFFLQSALFSDEVKQVLGVCRLLHHVDEGIAAFEEVKETNDTIY